MGARALEIIRGEHRSLAAVLHALQFLARNVRNHGAAPDYGLLRLMVDYIESFHQRFHHPKEDEYLFNAIRKRTREADTTLADLEAQHTEGDGWLQDLRGGEPVAGLFGARHRRVRPGSGHLRGFPLATRARRKTVSCRSPSGSSLPRIGR